MFGPEKSSFAPGGRGAGGTSSVEVNYNTNTTNTDLCLQTRHLPAVVEWWWSVLTVND